MNFLLQVGLRIRELRYKNKMTQEELALKVGYTSRSSINKIEKGLVDLPQSKIAEIAEALGTTPTYLMGWEDLTPMDDFVYQPIEPEHNLTPSEQALLDIFRLIPEEQQKVFLEMGRVYANSLKKD